MRKVYLLGVIMVLILIAGYTRYSRIKSTTPINFAAPEIAIQSMLPESWTLSVEENTVPTEWKGKSECKLIKLNNPSEKYIDPNAPGRFEYTAWHNFWFCPKNWVGQMTEFRSEQQVYPAALLCDCANFKIFHLSLGENSQKDLPERVRLEFAKYENNSR